MKKYAYPVAFAALAASIFGGCYANTKTQKIPKPEIHLMRNWEGQRPLKEVAPQNVDKANGLGIDLFRNVFKREGRNICVSPVSMLFDFAMMANGDNGDTRDEILEILGYGKGEEALENLNTYCNALLADATSQEGATRCEFTNSVWYEPTLPIMPEFASDIQNIFNGTLFPIWPGNEAGKKAINEFVKEHTYGLIPKLLSNPMDVRLAFLNTTYFKGKWQNKFDKSYDSKFHNADGTESETTFMWADADLQYCAIEDMKGVVLPYAGGQYTMTVIQPANDTDFNTMLDSLSPSLLKDLQASTRTEEVILSLPKFNTEININMDPILQDLGFDRIFSPGIGTASDHYLQLVEVIHAVKIIVDEEGTEAAAASIFGDADCIHYPAKMTFNRPFVYMIKDTASDTILFMGAITAF